MNAKNTALLGLLVWGALLGTAQAEGKLQIEVVGSKEKKGEASAAKAPTISNASIRERDEDPRPLELGPGEVFFRFDEADLTTEVLPLIRQQVGLRVRYRGPARAVTLRLTAPMHWEQALELIARFSNTHLKRGAKGKLELRNRYGGKTEGKYDDLDGQVKLAVKRPRRRNVTLPPRNVPRIRLQVLASAPVRGQASVGGNRTRQTSARVGFRPAPPRLAPRPLLRRPPVQAPPRPAPRQAPT
ncbi:MAG TPA: hypothetical protein DEA08_16835, partial [Planctomycetes bacterium]|nr:hypothetical protein [Planctomycetota bacterium]